MKIRNDFVTNSSSSSFIISKKNLTDNQILAIENYYELGLKLNLWDDDYEYMDLWEIKSNNNHITGFTWMDNIQIQDLFEVIGIRESSVIWGEDPFYLKDEEDEDSYQPKYRNPEWEDTLREILR